ncbi:HPr-rel-A system PqqD family peptide chaperone [Thauera sp. JM12B12]|uniref:HPr-rel-A system PqqD family peptide chaperone n=1 Tax=Thauera sp. JM12B12 TaxID=3142262 RepID=UPI0031F371CB
MRFLGEGAVVFNSLTWQTHLLPAELAAVAAEICELAASGPVTPERLQQQLARESGLSCEDFEALVAALSEIGLLDA